MFDDEQLIDELIDSKNQMLSELLVGKKIIEAYVDDVESLYLVTEDGKSIKLTTEETEFGFQTIRVEVEE